MSAFNQTLSFPTTGDHAIQFSLRAFRALASFLLGCFARSSILRRIADYISRGTHHNLVNLVLVHQAFFSPVASSLWVTPESLYDVFALLPEDILRIERSVAGHYVLVGSLYFYFTYY